MVEPLPKVSQHHDYLVASGIALLWALVFGVYQFSSMRVGMSLIKSGDLLIIDKVIAEVAAWMVTLTLLEGPVTRYFNLFDRWLSYRKEIGVVGAILAFMHIILVAFFSWRGVALETEFYHLTFLGLFSIFILAGIILATILQNLHQLDGVRWWFYQRWGVRLAVASLFLDAVTVKGNEWIHWYGEVPLSSLSLPPLGVLIALFILWVLFLRVYESCFLFRSIGWRETREISHDPTLVAHGQRLFFVSFSILLFFCGLLFFR